MLTGISELPSKTINLLKSTQVITSLGSVVKELIENSLDAEATVISIKLENYGFDKIEVKDNGVGIKEDDVQFIAQPHFTSKINCFEDLGNLSSYGFRGEALASLSTVSDVTISTKCKDNSFGFSYKLNSKGNILSKKPAAITTGTSILVQNLFKCLPVRRQFYSTSKRKKDELRRIEHLAMAFAVIKPTLHLTLLHDKNIIFQKPSTSETKLCLHSVFQDNAKKLVHKHHELENLRLEVWLPGAVESCCSASSPDKLFIYANERPISCKAIEKLAKAYYSQKLEGAHGKYPLGVISIRVPPSHIDVNLEPNKTRVFFQQEKEILESLQKVLVQIYGPILSAAEARKQGSDWEDVLPCTLAQDQSQLSGCERDLHDTNHRSLPNRESSPDTRLEREEQLPKTTTNRGPKTLLCRRRDANFVVGDRDAGTGADNAEGGMSELNCNEGLGSQSRSFRIGDHTRADANFCFNLQEDARVPVVDRQDEEVPINAQKNFNHGLNLEEGVQNGGNVAEFGTTLNERVVAEENVCFELTTEDGETITGDSREKRNERANANNETENERTNESRERTSEVVNKTNERVVGRMDEKSAITTGRRGETSDLNGERENEAPNPTLRRMSFNEDRLSLNWDASARAEKDPQVPKDHSPGRRKAGEEEETPGFGRSWSEGRVFAGKENIQSVQLFVPPIPPKERPSPRLGLAPPASKRKAAAEESPFREERGAACNFKRLRKDRVHTLSNSPPVSSHPKKPDSAFALFAKATRRRVIEENPGSDFTVIAQELATRWKNADAVTKRMYETKAANPPRLNTSGEARSSPSSHTDTRRTNSSHRNSSLFSPRQAALRVQPILARRPWQNKVLPVKFTIQRLKDKLKRNARVEMPPTALVGSLKGVNGWIYRSEHAVCALNSSRLNEVILFRTLVGSFCVPTIKTEFPVALSPQNLGHENWETLLSLRRRPVDEGSAEEAIVDPRVASNGFGVALFAVSLDEDASGFKAGELSSIADSLPDYGIGELREVLSKLRCQPDLCLEKSRPSKLRHWFKEQALRMGRASPHIRDLAVLEEKMNIWSQLEPQKGRLDAVCAHGNPIFNVISVLEEL